MGFAVTYAFTMGATSASASVNLQAAYEKVYLMVPTMPSTTSFDVYGSVDGSTYYQFRHDANPNTATVQIPTFVVAATLSSGGAIMPLPGGFQYYKLIPTDSAPTTAIGFKIICGTE